MGYAVYEDRTARDLGVERFAGYGVPAECDYPMCKASIDRGMAYRCEEYIAYVMDPDTEEELELPREGCGLHFCDEHEGHPRHGDDIQPKPDLAVWNLFLLLDPSWRQWRAEYPYAVRRRQVALLRSPIKTALALPQAIREMRDAHS